MEESCVPVPYREESSPGLMAPGGCSAAGAVSLTELVSDIIILLSEDMVPVLSVLVFCPLPQEAIKNIPAKAPATKRQGKFNFLIKMVFRVS